MPRHAMKVRCYFLPAAACAMASALYPWDVPDDPPGFQIDESSIANNAHAVSRAGADEYGGAWPVYFSAFGDYKNPVYVYALAAVFRVTGPGEYVLKLDVVQEGDARFARTALKPQRRRQRKVKATSRRRAESRRDRGSRTRAPQSTLRWREQSKRSNR